MLGVAWADGASQGHVWRGQTVARAVISDKLTVSETDFWVEAFRQGDMSVNLREIISPVFPPVMPTHSVRRLDTTGDNQMCERQ